MISLGRGCLCVSIILTINILVSECSLSSSSPTTDKHSLKMSIKKRESIMQTFNVGPINEELRKEAYRAYMRSESPPSGKANETRVKRRSRSQLSFKTYLIHFMFGMFDEMMEAMVRWANRVDSPNVYDAKAKNYGIQLPCQAYTDGINFEASKNSIVTSAFLSLLGIPVEAVFGPSQSPPSAEQSDPVILKLNNAK